MHSRPRFLYALLVLPLLMGAKDGGGCCGRKDVDTDAVRTDIPDVESRLQVVSIEPHLVDPDQRFAARVFGGGFQSGATVKIGETQAGNVDVIDENTIAMSVPGLSLGSYDVVVTNPDGGTARLRQGLTVRSAIGDCSFVRVSFEFDEAGLSGPGKSLLDSKMACFQATSGPIQIEGHADERGTTEYNLALGERRAETVKRYLANQGVQASRVGTVSYGEERPVATGHDESAWAQNRRADIHVTE